MDAAETPDLINTNLVEESPSTLLHPYSTHPSGVECIQIVEHMNFNLGSAVRCIWRHQEDEIEDLRKARWYIDREISRLIQKNEQ